MKESEVAIQVLDRVYDPSYVPALPNDVWITMINPPIIIITEITLDSPTHLAADLPTSVTSRRGRWVTSCRCSWIFCHLVQRRWSAVPVLETRLAYLQNCDREELTHNLRCCSFHVKLPCRPIFERDLPITVVEHAKLVPERRGRTIFDQHPGQRDLGRRSRRTQ